MNVCQRCLGLLLVGLDADHVAVVARVDYARLTPLGEVLALTAGRGTYSLSAAGGRLELDFRDRWRMGRARSPAEVVVLGQHVCGVPLPPEAYDKRRPLEPSDRKAYPDDPPF